MKSDSEIIIQLNFINSKIGAAIRGVDYLKMYPEAKEDLEFIARYFSDKISKLKELK